MGRNLKGVYSRESDEWTTPKALFEELDAEFNFDLDPCATDENHKCDRYFTKSEDGLQHSWGGYSFRKSSIFRNI